MKRGNRDGKCATRDSNHLTKHPVGRQFVEKCFVMNVEWTEVGSGVDCATLNVMKLTRGEISIFAIGMIRIWIWRFVV